MAFRKRVVALIIPACLLLAGILIPSSSARADALTSLSLVNGNATGGSVSLTAQSTPYLFTGFANAADDTISINAVFSSGTASATVALGAASPSSPVALTSGIDSPVTISSGMNEIVVTHTDGAATTTYTLRVTRSWPISGYEIINADDSTVLASKTGGGFDPADQDDTLLVGHDVDRVRVRMFYTDPTEASALPTNATIWSGCGVGCVGPDTVTSGSWTAPITLSVGDQVIGLYASINSWYPYEGTRWNIRTTRAAAYTSDTLTSLSLVNGNATGGSVSLTAQSTPYLFTGIANAADDTISINAVFSSGTASATVALGAASPSSPVALTSGIDSPVPISSGLNEIVVTHVNGATTTTYTLRFTRSWPISGYEIINADDSTVLASKTGGGFDPADQDDTLLVGHDVDRVRVRMFYTDPTEATALPTNATIWWGCGVGCSGPRTVTSGQWSDTVPVTVGDQTIGLYSSIPDGGTSWRIRTTRSEAFTSDTLTALTLVDGNATGTSIPLSASATPYLFTGIANAADDTISINAVFSSGTASATVALGAASPSSPVALTSGIDSPVPISSGLNEIVVTHVNGATTTTYTLRFTRSWPISGYEIINADDSTVLASKTGGGFDPADQDDTLLVGHDVDRVRVRMFYTDPTEATALPTNATIWWGCGVGCSGPRTVTSGSWTAPITLSVGDQVIGLYASINSWYPYLGTRWNIRTTRASAFASISSVSLPGSVPPVGTPVPAGSAITVSPAGVSGSPTPTVTYDWEAADDTTSAFTVVATTETPTWTPDATVADKYIRVTATADNGISTPSSVTTPIFGPISVPPTAPGISSASLSGTEQVGMSLMVTASGVSGYPSPILTYQWESSPSGGGSFAAISGATASSYTLSASDEGRVVRAVVTATNATSPAATATTSPTGAISAGVAPAPTPGDDPGATPGADGVPGAPGSLVVESFHEALTVSWAAAQEGAFPVTNYQVTAGKATCLTLRLTCTLTGLTNGTSYDVEVRALNGAGWGASSATVAAPKKGTLTVQIKRTKRRIILTGTAVGFLTDTEVSPRVHARVGKRPVPGRPAVTVNESGDYTWDRRLNRRKTFTVYMEFQGLVTGSLKSPGKARPGRDSRR